MVSFFDSSFLFIPPLMLKSGAKQQTSSRRLLSNTSFILEKKDVLIEGNKRVCSLSAGAQQIKSKLSFY